MVQVNGTVRSTTWVYQNSTWSAVPSAETPFTECCGAMAFDPVENETVLVGGFVYGNNTVGDYNSNSTWVLSNGTWTWIPTNSTFRGRYGESLVYDAADRYLMMFGGDAYGAAGYAPQTWRFHAGVWSQVFPKASPGGRDGASIAYDAADGYVLLFGGYSGGHWLDDTWSYTNGTWTNLTSTLASSPSGRASATMEYDAYDGYVVLFGGGGKGGDLNDTWKFQNGSWTNITAIAGTAPSPRDQAAAAYVPTQDYILLFGGGDFYSGRNPYFGSNVQLADTWTFSTGKWHREDPAQSPAARSGAVATFDPNLGAVVMYGGDADFFNDASTWGWMQEGPLAAGTVTVFPANPEANGSLTLGAGSSGGSGVDGYRWFGLPGGCTSANASEIRCVPTIAGTYNVTVNITDEEAGTTIVDGPVEVAVAPSLHAGSLSANPLSLDVGQNLTLASRTSGGVSPLSFGWTGLPPGCTGSDRATLACSPTTAGVYSIDVRVTDAYEAVATVGPAVVDVYGVLTAGELTSERPTIDLGQLLSVQAGVSGGVPPVAVGWAGLPTGCAGSSSLNLICTPNATGAWNVSAQITDATGASTEDGPVQIVVLPAVEVISVALAPNATDVGGTTSIDATVAGGRAPYSFAFTGLPKGCESTNSSMIACTPRDEGTFVVAVLVADALGGTASLNGTLFVAPAPAVTGFSASPPLIDVKETTTLTAVISGGTAPFLWIYSGLPAGCYGSDASTLKCVPDAPGASTVEVRVVDSVGLNATQTLPLTVDEPLATPTFSAYPPELQLGNTTILTVKESGGTPPYSVTYTGLPAGCTSVDSLSLGCTPSQTGNFTIAALLTDSAEQPQEANLTLVVEPIPHSGPGGSPGGGGSGVGALLSPNELALSLVAAVIAVSVIVAVLLLRRRDRPRTPEEVRPTADAEIGPPPAAP